EVQAKYLYGMTATPKREDGQEQKVYMQLGPVRYRLTAKDRAKCRSLTIMCIRGLQTWSISQIRIGISIEHIKNWYLTSDEISRLSRTWKTV
ncbi:MAG: hypothetical protein LBR68_02570, partial [Lachnoclostridium sp.]|nr:hypothetical protein [Lachnoclostridium sp.]